MPIILDEFRPRRRHSAIAPNVREVCLIGTPSRHYQHLTPFLEGLRDEEPALSRAGLSRERRAANGVPKSGTG